MKRDLSQSQDTAATVTILFVCHANICRSPMAEVIMQAMLQQAGLKDAVTVASAGIAAWVGQPIYTQARKTLEHYGMSMGANLSRQLEHSDLMTFDYVLAMDQRTLDFILRHSAGSRADLRLFLTFANDAGLVKGDEVRDPFPNGDYDLAYRVINAGCGALLQHLIKTDLSHEK
jgi:protein-tyrosine phosphatase